jgi:N-acetylneuraminic acid mutarotase
MKRGRVLRRRPAPARMMLLAVAVVAIGLTAFFVAREAGSSAAACEGETTMAPSNQLGSRSGAGEGWNLLPSSPLSGRHGHAAVWTGREMILWGGVAPEDDGHEVSRFNDAAAYEPRTRRWSEIERSPLGATGEATVVWTGAEALFWGPSGGAAYRPTDDCWRSLPGSPLADRHGHSAIWTGKEMIVWGGGAGAEEEGVDGEPPIFADGAAYDPSSGEWRSLSESPLAPRLDHTAVWTGEEMLVWGGYGERDALYADGAAYDPRANEWEPLPLPPIAGRFQHSAVWTGEEMIVWGGRDLTDRPTPLTGAAYEPLTRRWRRLPPAPLPNITQSAVWTGDEMLVWGGTASDRAAGAAYDPATDAWRKLPDSSLEGRANHSAIWTGEEMIVWGGYRLAETGFDNFEDGAAYRP